MEIRDLKYILSLAERGSFTAAARDHFVTQPAVSIRLGKLQRELGVRLFEVEGRKVRFTRAGEIVCGYARRMASLERQLDEELEDLAGLKKGSIAIGTIDAASIYVLPDIFSKFQSLYPGIDVHLEIASTAPLLDALAEGRLDLVVGTMPGAAGRNVDVFPVFRERLVIIAPPGHPLASRKSMKPPMLAEHPFISFHRGSITRGIIEDVLRAAGVVPRITMEIDSPEAIKKLVSSGLGLAVLPSGNVEEDIDRGRVAALRVRGLSFERRLGLFLAGGRYLALPVKAFLGIMARELSVELPDSYCLNQSCLDGATDSKGGGSR